MKRKNNQKGFTIIELVVVILLLGILTATALPRFMAVEDEAHDAVVTAVASGLRTSAALFRAQWMAEGQPSTIDDYGTGMRASRTGYPMGIWTGATPSSITASADCEEVFDNLLQAGAPSTGSKTAAAAALATINNSTTDFIAYLNTTSTVTRKLCYFAYTGEYNDTSVDGATLSIPVIKYDTTTGAVTLETEI
jgi:MSHA pilin protein MshB